MTRFSRFFIATAILFAGFLTPSEAQSTPQSEEKLEIIDVNGVSLHYVFEKSALDKDEYKGEIVLLHGNGGSHKSLSYQIKQFSSAGYDVYAIDSRGQGANEKLSEYHYTDMAEDVYQFISSLSLERPAVYGFSDGGIIALYLELMHPGTSSSLSISGANIFPQGCKPYDDWVAKYDNPSASPLKKMLILEPTIKPEELSAINIPVLVMAGSDDLITDEHTRLIARSLPHSKLIIFEGYTHGSYIKGCPLAGEAILEFLKEHPVK